MTTMSGSLVSSDVPAIPNGSGAAAILAAGIGSFVLALIAFAGDKSPHVKNILIFYKPTGPLSGVVILAIIIWLLSWGILGLLWGKKDLRLSKVNAAAFVLLALSLVLTFPPIIDAL